MVVEVAVVVVVYGRLFRLGLVELAGVMMTAVVCVRAVCSLVAHCDLTHTRQGMAMRAGPSLCKLEVCFGLAEVTS